MPKRRSEPPIGPVLKELRRKRRLTQEALASMAETHQNYIGGIERGERNPTMKTIGRILVALDVTWTELGQILDAKLRRGR